MHYRFRHFTNEFHLLLNPRVRYFVVIEMHQRLRRTLRLDHGHSTSRQRVHSTSFINSNFQPSKLIGN
jgi:hypothetical protein